MKKKLRMLVVLFIVVVVCFMGVQFNSHMKKEEENKVISAMLFDREDLVTQELDINDVFKGTIGDIPIINKKDCSVEYSTTVQASTDLSKASVKVTDDKIVIDIPHNKIDEDTIKVSSKDISINKTNFSLIGLHEKDTLELISKVEKEIKSISQKSDLLKNADAHTKEAIMNLYKDFNREVEVRFINA